MSSLPRVSASLAILLVAVTAATRLVTGGLAADGTPSDVDLAQAKAASDQIAREQEEAAERHAFNRQLLARLAQGRITLPEAVAAHRELNRDAPGYAATIPNYPGVADREVRERLNVLRLVQVHISDRPDRGAVLARLVKEYEAAWGRFPLKSVDDLPGDNPAAFRPAAILPAASGIAPELPPRPRRTAR